MGSWGLCPQAPEVFEAWLGCPKANLGRLISRGSAPLAHRRSGYPLRGCSSAVPRSASPNSIDGTWLTGLRQAGTVEASSQKGDLHHARPATVSADSGDHEPLVRGTGRTESGERRSECAPGASDKRVVAMRGMRPGMSAV